MEETLAYCIQCKDTASGKIGSFIYSTAVPFKAISPVFVDLVGLHAWMKEHKYASYSSGMADLRVYRVI